MNALKTKSTYSRGTIWRVRTRSYVERTNIVVSNCWVTQYFKAALDGKKKAILWMSGKVILRLIFRPHFLI